MRVLDKAEYTSAVGGETVKEQYLAREGQVVSKERFIFACYEAQNHLSKIDGSFKKEFEWPELDHSTVEAFNSRLERMLAWHYSNHAVFHNHKTMDLASLTYLSIQLAHLEKDFKRLCAQSGMLEDKNGRPVQIALNELIASIKKIFSNALTDFITSYFNWIYTKPKMTVVDFDQVPPVGRYAKMVIHSRAHKTPAEPLLEQTQATPKTNQRPAEAKNHEKNHTPSAQRDFGNQPGGKRDSRPDRAFRDRKPEAEKNPAQEAATLSLVDDALKLLQTDSSLNEIVLDPQNSYYRRLQHQRAVDAGFLSDSIGEGKERAVKISRPK